MRYYTEQTDNSLPTFWDELTFSSSRTKISKREKRRQLKFNDMLLFWDLQLSNFSKKQEISEMAVLPFSWNKMPNLMDPLDQVILNHTAPQKQ
jgi:hypothetical protein